MRRCLGRDGSGNAYTGLDSPMSQVRDSLNGHKTPVSALFEQGDKIGFFCRIIP